jgi:hypothetical protein
MRKSYVRPDDGATMVEAVPHQYVSAKILELQGAIPAPWNTMNRPGDGEARRKTACRKAVERAGPVRHQKRPEKRMGEAPRRRFAAFERS